MVRSCREPELAADLAAETFATALTAARRGRAGTDTGWIWAIAKSRLIDAHRRGKVADRARTRLGMQRIVVDDEAAEIVATLDLRAELETAMASLDPDQRAAVIARVVNDESYVDIADRLQHSPQVVRKRVSRGLATLRQNLEDRS
jgi:RNA polymerase sigma-70 factor (ECF subfamily)